MQIHLSDNVEVCLEDGHKYALQNIACGENIIKYGNPIGHATANIQKGELVHSHNMKTNLSGKQVYRYTPCFAETEPVFSNKTFMGYVRENGTVGIRNEIWIVPTVGCVNKIGRALAEKTGVVCLEHPFGCSQLGDDQKTTQLILRGLVNHPNAAGVLVLGLGCENNNISVFKEVLSIYNEKRVRFLNVQDTRDELAEGLRIISELKAYAKQFKREQISISKLKIGLKCGGSDGFSGITANPLLGAFSDWLTTFGGSVVLTEVPEMFGAEHLLMQRCKTKELFDKTVALINNFKDYFTAHKQVIYENPSPGNKAGGITTLEEKSLGCVQKGGNGVVTDVLDYGDTVSKSGVSLLNGPGNDIVAVTNLAACGVHMILFTTGRGTPLGGPIPTVKVATNAHLAKQKQNWIDFDASPLLNGTDMQTLCNTFTEFVIQVASGTQTKNEINNYCDISIFKDGVVL